MKTLNWKNEINKQELQDVQECLKSGGLVIFPTETVYGLGAIATNKEAIDNIFIAKGRANDNPLIVHLGNVGQIKEYATVRNEIEQKLIESFMPGPITIILEKKDIIQNNVSANLNTVGIRIPSNKIANAILETNNMPIAAPSANISGKPSGTDIEDIIDEFKDKVDYIIDGGNTDIGLESTVVKVKDNIPVILRPGFITKEDIIDAVGICQVDNNVFTAVATGPVESPGMKYKHYAPNSSCLLVYMQNKEELTNYIKERTTNNTVIIGSSKLKNIPCKEFLYYGDTLEEVSHNIFRLLRKGDSYNPELILIEGVTKEGLGLAIMNRLIRSCGHNYIEK